MTAPKILSLAALAETVAALKQSGRRVVLCHGIFDLLHIGHIRHFGEARSHGDVLVVTVTPDKFVNKGANRPVFTDSLRMEAIAALDVVDHVAVNKWPTAVEATGDAFNRDVTPVSLIAHFDHPANNWRPEIRVSWYQGGALPNSPARWIDLNVIGHGAMFKGTKGVLLADFTTRTLIPASGADLTYYKPRPADKLTPPVGDFQEEWINACKGNLKTSCNFDYNGLMTEQMALGLVAYRVGKKLKYDGVKGLTDDAEANKLLRREHRMGWPLSG